MIMSNLPLHPKGLIGVYALVSYKLVFSSRALIKICYPGGNANTEFGHENAKVSFLRFLANISRFTYLYGEKGVSDLNSNNYLVSSNFLPKGNLYGDNTI